MLTTITPDLSAQLAADHIADLAGSYRAGTRRTRPPVRAPLRVAAAAALHAWRLARPRHLPC
jgi:hypothetical protein